MTGAGTVERIFTVPEPEVETVERSDGEVVDRSGLRGDRYFSGIETRTFVGGSQTKIGTTGTILR